MNPILKKVFYPFARYFIAGEKLEDAVREAKKLNDKGIIPIINFLGEHAKTETEAEAALKTYLEILEVIKKEKLVARISIKHSQLGLDIKEKPRLWLENVETILMRAKHCDIPVEIDIEDSSYVRATLDFLLDYPLPSSLRQAIQAYLFRTPKDLSLLREHQISPRLCKGGYYNEPKTVAIKNPEKIREKYLEYADLLISWNLYSAFATHDLKIVNYIRKNHGGKKELFEFQFLFGLLKRLWKELVDKGYQVAVYLPFGPNWLPYGTRRWKFVLRSFPGLIRDELLKRR